MLLFVCEVDQAVLDRKASGEQSVIGKACFFWCISGGCTVALKVDVVSSEVLGSC